MWKHVFRETNQPADILAKYGINPVTDGMVVFLVFVLISLIRNAIMADVLSTLFLREF